VRETSDTNVGFYKKNITLLPGQPMTPHRDPP
jgi:hypothetical protein